MDRQKNNDVRGTESADIIVTPYGVLCPDGVIRVSLEEYYDAYS